MRRSVNVNPALDEFVVVAAVSARPAERETARVLALMPRAAEVYRDQIDQGSAAIRLPQRRRLLEGEKVPVLCREFDVSRKTGYKIFSRYKDCGLEGLTDRSRRPY